MSEPGEIPADFASFIAHYFGDRGVVWLAALPGLLDHYACKWDLDLMPPFAGLSFHYVAPAVCADGTPAVLKLGVPEEEARTGIEFLRRCDGATARAPCGCWKRTMSAVRC